jgi:hypothetical protein
MPIKTSGALSLNEIHAEVGGTSGSVVSLNDTDLRGLTPASGYSINSTSGTQISVGDFYGASAAISLKTHGYIISVNTNALSYSGSLTANINPGDTIIIAKLTGYGSSSYGTDTLQGTSSPTYHISERLWSASGFYSQFRVFSTNATASASSVSLSIAEAGTTTKLCMVCYCWVINGTAQYNDTAISNSGNSSTTPLVVDTGEAALIFGHAWTRSTYSMPTWTVGAGVDADADRDYHVAITTVFQTSTAATHTMNVNRTGTRNRAVSFIGA